MTNHEFICSKCVNEACVCRNCNNHTLCDYELLQGERGCAYNPDAVDCISFMECKGKGQPNLSWIRLERQTFRRAMCQTLSCLTP